MNNLQTIFTVQQTCFHPSQIGRVEMHIAVVEFSQRRTVTETLKHTVVLHLCHSRYIGRLPLSHGNQHFGNIVHLFRIFAIRPMIRTLRREIIVPKKRIVLRVIQIFHIIKGEQQGTTISLCLRQATTTQQNQYHSIIFHIKTA